MTNSVKDLRQSLASLSLRVTSLQTYKSIFDSDVAEIAEHIKSITARLDSQNEATIDINNECASILQDIATMNSILDQMEDGGDDGDNGEPPPTPVVDLIYEQLEASNLPIALPADILEKASRVVAIVKYDLKPDQITYDKVTGGDAFCMGRNRYGEAEGWIKVKGETKQALGPNIPVGLRKFCSFRVLGGELEIRVGSEIRHIEMGAVEQDPSPGKAWIGQGRWNGKDVDPLRGTIYKIRIFDSPGTDADNEAQYQEWKQFEDEGDGEVEPPPPPPPSPPTEGLENPNPNALKISMTVSTQEGHEWYDFGCGLNSPTEAVRSEQYFSKYLSRIVDEPKARVARLNTADLAYKKTVLMMFEHGITDIVLTGYVARHKITPATWADQVAIFINSSGLKGKVKFWVSIENEPDGNPDNNYSSSLIVPWVQQLRSRLDQLGLQDVLIIGPNEWAHFGSRGRQEYDLLKAANLAGTVVKAGSGHFYKDGPRPEVWDQAWANHGVMGLWLPEIGNCGNPNFGARLASAMNNGGSMLCIHYAVIINSGSEPAQQGLIMSDGSRRPWHAQAVLMANALQRHSRFRLVTCSDRPSGLNASYAERGIRGGGSYNPRINFAFAKRPDGKYTIIAVNTTQGSSDFPSQYLTAYYKSTLIQPTWFISELAGKKGTFIARNCNQNGVLSPEYEVPMVDGQIRFTMPPSQTVVLVGS